jgi:DNA repair exonuclease SbcCD nuclease subunit
MSQTQVSTEGVSVTDFPAGIPVYSGHYHTPQQHGSIRYLGSPYQLTLSEAEDKKALVVIGQTQNKLGRDVTVELPGGKLKVYWKGPGNSVKMTGPAVHVFDGQLNL